MEPVSILTFIVANWDTLALIGTTIGAWFAPQPKALKRKAVKDGTIQ